MKIKEVIRLLELLNPEKDLLMRVYIHNDGYYDLLVNDIRLVKKECIPVMSNQCGVE